MHYRRAVTVISLTNLLFPLQRIDHMFEIFLEEIIHNREGVLIGRYVKIQGAAQEMPGGIGEEELFCSSGIPAYLEVHAMYTIGSSHSRIRYFRGFGGMFIGHFVGVVHQFHEIFPAAYILVADVHFSIKAGDLDIDPVWIVGIRIKKSGILFHCGIHGILK